MVPFIWIASCRDSVNERAIGTWSHILELRVSGPDVDFLEGEVTQCYEEHSTGRLFYTIHLVGNVK